ncbi:hypothetical protein V6N13_065049 [Hibiscus sabdariffa]
MGFDLESLAEAISGAIGSLEHLAVLWEAIANGVAAGACTVIITQISQPLDTAFSRMQTSEFGKSKGLWKTLFESSWSEAFDALDISLLLTTNPSIQIYLPPFLSAFSAFVLGAGAKCNATFVTHPAIRCKVTIQADVNYNFISTEVDFVTASRVRRSEIVFYYY